MTGHVSSTLTLSRTAVGGRPELEVRSFDRDPAPPHGRRRPPRKWTWLIGALAAGLGATALVVVDDATSSEAPPPVAEPAVAAEELPAGSMYHVVDQINARSLWEQGITGDGVNIAVIDTGFAPVDGLMDDGKVVAAIDLSAEAAAPMTAIRDNHGHGTAMAGIAVGRESGADPALAAEHPEWFLGVAPDAGLVSVKVGDRHGNVAPGGLVAAVNWVVDHADEYDIRVVNLSVGTPSGIPADRDPLIAAVQRAWDAGITIVTAAGNLGPDTNGLSAPASDPFVIAVGGADMTEGAPRAAEWSSSGDGVRNPDFAAPGAHIQTLRAPGSDADVNHPEGYVDAETFQMSGSSPAAAAVAGAVALLLDQRPELTNDQVKALLATTTTPIDGTPEIIGTGLIDVAAAAAAEAPAVQQDFPRSTVDPVSAAPTPDVPVVDWSGASWWGASWWGASWW